MIEIVLKIETTNPEGTLCHMAKALEEKADHLGRLLWDVAILVDGVEGNDEVFVIIRETIDALRNYAQQVRKVMKQI